MDENGHRFETFDDDLSNIEESRAARQLSEQIDLRLAGQPVTSDLPEMAIAETLSRVNELLPPVDPAFEERTLEPLRRRERRWPALRLPVRAISLAATAALLALAVLLTVPGQMALARLAAIFHLESVQVGINVATATPAETHRVVTPRVERPLSGLRHAREVAPVPILAPAGLPTDWALQDATAVYYPDLPADVPLSIILTYASSSGASLEIVEYFVQLGDNLTIGSLSRADETLVSAREVTVDGRRAVLIEGDDLENTRTLIWQQGDLLLEIEAHNVSVENLLAVAASVQPVR